MNITCGIYTAFSQRTTSFCSDAVEYVSLLILQVYQLTSRMISPLMGSRIMLHFVNMVPHYVRVITQLNFFITIKSHLPYSCLNNFPSYLKVCFISSKTIMENS